MATRQEVSSLSATLQASGFRLPFDVREYLDKAIRNSSGDPGLAANLAYSYITQSKRFRSYYPGIFRSNGTLRVTPAQYEQIFDSYAGAAGSAGFSLSRKQAGVLLARGVSADEFSFRVKAARQIQVNATSLNSFNQVLKSYGQAPIKTGEQAFDLLAGRANANTYALYEQFAFTQAAAESGLKVDARQAKRLAAGTAEVTSLEEARKGFASAAEAKQKAGAELAGFGVSRDMLLKAIFGEDAEAKRLVSQALLQREASLRAPASGQQVGLSREGRPIVAGPSQQAGF